MPFSRQAPLGSGKNTPVGTLWAAAAANKLVNDLSPH